jgi:hypothetical protein
LVVRLALVVGGVLVVCLSVTLWWAERHGYLAGMVFYHVCRGDASRSRFIDGCKDPRVLVWIMADDGLPPCLRSEAAMRVLRSPVGRSKRAVALSVLFWTAESEWHAIDRLVSILREEQDVAMLGVVIGYLRTSTHRADVALDSLAGATRQEMVQPWVRWWEENKHKDYEAILRDAVSTGLAAVESEHSTGADLWRSHLVFLLRPHYEQVKDASPRTAEWGDLKLWWDQNKNNVVLSRRWADKTPSGNPG